jgi:Family of unknown function (DUF6788)
MVWVSGGVTTNTDSSILLSAICCILLPVNPRARSLERQIEKVKEQLVRLDALRMGSLSEQYNVCGTPGCRRKASPPEKHGPYHQLSFTRKGKSTTRFVRRENLATVKKQLRNYARLRTLVDRWIDLASELSNLQLSEDTQTPSIRRRRA